MKELLEKLNKLNFGDVKVTFKEWTKYNKERIYVNIAKGKDYGTIGYIENNVFTLTAKVYTASTTYEVEDIIKESLVA